MYFYEYWYFIKDLNRVLEEKNKENNNLDEQMKGYSSIKQGKTKMPNIKMPSVNLPKY